jgi:CheY-like chemotaxis protein
MKNLVKILFLDDSQERWEIFSEVISSRDYIELVWVKTSDEAIKRLNQCKWDIICLDHDLNGIGLERSTDLTGYEVAEHISKDSRYNGDLIFIHSWNPEGAKNMRKILNRSIYIPFSNSYANVVLDYSKQLIKGE